MNILLEYIKELVPLFTLISAFVILWVQCRQNHEENKQNRTLQINAIKCQQMNDMLTDEKKTLASLLVTLDINRVLEILMDLKNYYDNRNPINCSSIKDKNLKEIFKFNREIGNDSYLYDFLLNKQHITYKQKEITDKINDIIREYKYIMQDLIMLYANIEPAINGKTNVEDIKLFVDQNKGKDKEENKEENKEESELCVLLEKYDYKFYEHTHEIISGLYGSLRRKINNNGNIVLESYINQLIKCEQDKIDALLKKED